MLWSPAASSSQQRARVLTDVKARRFAPRPRSAGRTALTPAPRTLVQIGSCRRCSLIHPLHVVVDVPSRMTLFRATADTWLDGRRLDDAGLAAYLGYRARSTSPPHRNSRRRENAATAAAGTIGDRDTTPSRAP